MQRAIRGEDAMAGDQQGGSVTGHDGADGTGGIGVAGKTGELFISDCLAIGYFHTCLQDFTRKRGESRHVKRAIE